MSLTISGIGISRGIAIGRVHRLETAAVDVYEAAIPKELVEDEVARFRRAIRTARQQLKAIRNAIPESTPADITEFIDTHLLMLEDTMLTVAPVDLIRQNLCNAEWALKMQRDALARVFEEMDDPYLRTRMDDVDHVVARIQRILIGGSGERKTLRLVAQYGDGCNLFGDPTRVKHLFVEGRQIVRDGQITTIDLPRMIERQNSLARTLMG